MDPRERRHRIARLIDLAAEDGSLAVLAELAGDDPDYAWLMAQVYEPESAPALAAVPARGFERAAHDEETASALDDEDLERVARQAVETPRERRRQRLEAAKEDPELAPALYRLLFLYRGVEVAEGCAPPETHPVDGDLERMWGLAEGGLDPIDALCLFRQEYRLACQLLELPEEEVGEVLSGSRDLSGVHAVAPGEGVEPGHRRDLEFADELRPAELLRHLEGLQLGGADWKGVIRSDERCRSLPFLGAILREVSRASSARRRRRLIGMTAFATRVARRKGGDLRVLEDLERERLIASALLRLDEGDVGGALLDVQAAEGLERPESDPDVTARVREAGAECRKARRAGFSYPPSRFLDDLVVWALLYMEEFELRFRDGKAGLRALQIAARIVDKLAERVSVSSRGHPAAPPIVNLAARVHARLANAWRYAGQLEEGQKQIEKNLKTEKALTRIYSRTYRLNSEAAAEVWRFEAAVKSYTRDSDKALRCAEAAIALYENFDPHLAAVCRVMAAAIQRSLGLDSHLATLRAAAEGIHAARSAVIAEGIQNNLLFYTVHSGNTAKAEIDRLHLPFPRNRSTRARRFYVEGSIDLAQERFDSADCWLSQSVSEFVELDRKQDAACALIYKAEISVKRADLLTGRDQIREAAVLFRASGYRDLAFACEQERERLDRTLDCIRRLRILAERAGGCLPRGGNLREEPNR